MDDFEIRTEPVLRVFVRGTPKPKGSPRPIRNQHTGKTAMVIDSDEARTWGQAIAGEVALARQRIGPAPLLPKGTPVACTLVFLMKRRNGDLDPAGQPKWNAIDWHVVEPDGDKLCRTVLDAVKHGGAYHDDSQVCALHVFKRYGNETGVRISVERVLEAERVKPAKATRKPKRAVDVEFQATIDAKRSALQIAAAFTDASAEGASETDLEEDVW